MTRKPVVMPAQAGIQGTWIPAPRFRGDKFRGNDEECVSA